MKQIIMSTLLLTTALANATLSPMPEPRGLEVKPAATRPYILDDDTEIILDGLPVQWKDVPDEVVVIEFVTFGRHIERIVLRRKK